MSQTNQAPRITLTARQAAEYLGISYWLILELVKQKKIPFIAFGSRKLFRKDTLDKWMEEQENQSIKEGKTSNEYGRLRKIY